MQFVWLGISGIVGGILGGMGMGGGTLLIPLLTIFCGVKQHLAQAINLISFVPMSIVVLIIHAKNKLIDKEKILWVIIFGILSCIGGCFLSENLSGNLLKKLFGGFLILLAIFQFIVQLKNEKTN